MVSRAASSRKINKLASGGLGADLSEKDKSGMERCPSAQRTLVDDLVLIPDLKKKHIQRLQKQSKAAKRKKHKQKEIENKYKIRTEIVEENDVHCLAFTAPLMDYGTHNDSDYEVYDDDLDPCTVSAKKKWKRLYEIIMDHRTQIPLKQMAWKVKHEQQLFDKM